MTPDQPALGVLLQRRELLFASGASLLLPGIVRADMPDLPPPAQDLPPGDEAVATAVFAGGCFWGVQGVFQHVAGVRNAVSGYSGGTAATANYRAVSSGRTGHAEAVQITYDPRQVSYGALLQIFFSVAHDPTQRDRQGPDIGPQYRSAIFTTSPAQLAAAQAYIAQLDATRLLGKPIVTQVQSAGSFHPAEPYHQDYMSENPHAPYVVVHELPKIERLKQRFPQRYRAQPVLVKRPG